MLQNILTITELVVGILLIVAIMLQQKGSGLGAAFGGGNAVYNTKRGADLFLHKATIILSLIFFGVGLLAVIL